VIGAVPSAAVPGPGGEGLVAGRGRATAARQRGGDAGLTLLSGKRPPGAVCGAWEQL